MDWLFPAGASRGGTVEVTAGGKFDQWPAKFVCNHPGVKVSPLKDKGKLSIQVAANATPGPCLIRALDDSGPGNSRPFVVGHLPGVTAREPDNEPSSALPVTIPAVVEGKLEKSGDVDCFTVELKAGQTLVASLMANHLLGSPMDAVMQVVSPTGIVLAQNNDAGSLDPEIVFRAGTAGVYRSPVRLSQRPRFIHSFRGRGFLHLQVDAHHRGFRPSCLALVSGESAGNRPCGGMEYRG